MKTDTNLKGYKAPSTEHRESLWNKSTLNRKKRNNEWGLITTQMSISRRTDQNYEKYLSLQKSRKGESSQCYSSLLYSSSKGLLQGFLSHNMGSYIIQEEKGKQKKASLIILKLCTVVSLRKQSHYQSAQVQHKKNGIVNFSIATVLCFLWWWGEPTLFFILYCSFCEKFQFLQFSFDLQFTYVPRVQHPVRSNEVGQSAGTEVHYN